MIRQALSAVAMLLVVAVAIKCIHYVRFFECNNSLPLKPREKRSSGSTDAFFTPFEMTQALYAEDKYLKPVKVSDVRYANMIRSRMTRPDPSKPINTTAFKSHPPDHHFSQHGQSRKIDGWLGGRRNGFFIECGAHDGEINSNSLFFEMERNWTGLLIEPNPTSYRQLLQKNRNVYTLNACLSLTNRSIQTTFMDAEQLGGIKESIPEEMQKLIRTYPIPIADIQVQCFPLMDVLDMIGVYHIDFLSLDIEGPELEVLGTIDWQRVRIDIMALEVGANKKKRHNIRKLMKRVGGYREIGSIVADVIFERIMEKTNLFEERNFT